MGDMIEQNLVVKSNSGHKFCRSHEDSGRHSTILRENTQLYTRKGGGTAIAAYRDSAQVKQIGVGQITNARYFRQEDHMNCSRCHGLMVGDDLIDVRESYLPMWIRSLRCISCGNIVDATITRNRVRQQADVVPTLGANVRRPVMPRHTKAA